MKTVQIFTLLFVQVQSLKVNCGPTYDNYKDWDCDEIHFYLSDANLKKTLYCIGYDKTLSPSEYSGTKETKYYVNQDVKQFISIEENKLVITVQMYANNSYFDERLNFTCDNKYQLVGKMFWNPSIQNANILSIKSIVVGGTTVYFYIKKNGSLELIWNAILTKQCQLNFQWYPFDSQRCTHHPTSPDAKLIHERRGTKRFENSEWTVYIEYNAQGTDFLLRRKISGMILHLYFPSLFITLGSMMSLYIPCDLHPARMALSVTTCLSMVTFFKGSQESWPKTSYIKAIGIWAAFCYSIVFFCLIEYCLVLVLSQDHLSHRKLSKAVEKLSRIIVPLLVLIFVVSYFAICLRN